MFIVIADHLLFIVIADHLLFIVITDHLLFIVITDHLLCLLWLLFIHNVYCEMISNHNKHYRWSAITINITDGQQSQ
jgi:hypothetical protein